MKIINRLEFLKLPSGTVYCKYTPQIFGDLHVKACNPSDGWGNDWLYTSLTGEFDIEGCGSSTHHHDTLVFAEDIGLEFKADYEVSGRDGLYEEDQLFCIYDKSDIVSLINKLQTIIQIN